MATDTADDITTWQARTATARSWLAGDYAHEWSSRVPEQGPSFQLRLAAHNPEDAFVVREVFTPAFRTLERMTHGRLRIAPRWEGASHPLNEGWQALRDRRVDITACYSSRSPELGFNFTQGLNLPGLFHSAALATLASELLYARYLKPEFDLQGVRMGRLKATDSDVIFSKHPIRSVSDMAGLRLFAGSGWHGEIYREMGATIVPLTSPDVREALRTGVIDAAAMTDGSATVFGVTQVAGFRLASGFGRPNLEYCLSPAAYDELPPDLQAPLSAWLSGLAQAECQVFYGLGGAHARAAFKDIGLSTVRLDAAEQLRWQAPVATVCARYIDAMEDQGLPGRRFMQDLDRITTTFHIATDNQLMQRAIFNPVPNLQQP